MSDFIPVLRAEADVAFACIAPGGFRILAALDLATKMLGRDLVLTSGTDSHATGRHPVGEAFDVRTKDFDVPTVLRLYRTLTDLLGVRFTVLYEVPIAPSDHMLAKIATVNPHATGPHLHVQVKKGTQYPPDGGIEVA
jgi:hypothetical protein